MNRRVRQMELAHGHADQQAEQLAAVWQEQMHLLQEAEAKLAELEKFLGDYMHAGAGAQNMAALLNRRDFIQRIGEAMRYQRALIGRQREQCQVAEQQWRAARAHAEALRSVHTRLHGEAQRQLERGEQAQQDERSGNARPRDEGS